MLRESRSADRFNNISSVFQSNSFAEKACVTLATGGCEHVRGEAKTKDKGMLRDKDELTFSVSWEARECESKSQGVRIALSRVCC